MIEYDFVSNEMESISLQKQLLREEISEELSALNDRDKRSISVINRLSEIENFTSSSAVMTYVSTDQEVDTKGLISELFVSSKIVVVPFCKENELGLVAIESFDELAPGAYDIPEPSSELRVNQNRLIKVEEIDLFVVPGVAFDASGRRLGRGKGYYDWLLSRASANAVFAGICFDCQLVDQVPTELYDTRMHFVLCESDTYRVN